MFDAFAAIDPAPMRAPYTSLAAALKSAGRGDITTEITDVAPFYFAEGYHQQYCFANPHG